jgi:hypothetical protein
MAHLVQELMLAQHGRTAQELLTKESFERWCHGYIFDAIKDQRFGQAFCNHFGVTDNHVFYERDVEKCKAMIRKRYLCNGQ